MFNPLAVLDWMFAASDQVRAAREPSPHLLPRGTAEEAVVAGPREHWLLRPWVMVAWSLALLVAIILLTHYVGGSAAAVAGVGAVLAVILFHADGESGWLPPPAARRGVGAGAHDPGEPRTGDPVVDAFLDRLEQMGTAEWRRVPLCRLSLWAMLRRDLGARRAYARVEALLRAHERQPQCDAIARAVRGALASDERLAAAGFWGPAFARMAATVLLLRHELSEAEVRVLYSAFERSIPRASLEAGGGAARLPAGSAT